jgi:hypothetical protein
MTTLSDLHRSVRTALSSGHVGSPVFVRYLLHRMIDGPALVVRLARITAVVCDWLGQPLDRVYALGSLESRHATLTLEFRGGATALVTWIGTAGRAAGVDLTVLGNHGAIYHDAGTSELWDEPAQSDAVAPDQALRVWIERALASHRPEDAGTQP